MMSLAPRLADWKGDGGVSLSLIQIYRTHNSLPLSLRGQMKKERKRVKWMQRKKRTVWRKDMMATLHGWYIDPAAISVLL